jgi:hypothetical protein
MLTAIIGSNFSQGNSVIGAMATAPVLFTGISSPPKVSTVFATAARVESGSAAAA